MDPFTLPRFSHRGHIIFCGSFDYRLDSVPISGVSSIKTTDKSRIDLVVRDSSNILRLPAYFFLDDTPERHCRAEPNGKSRRSRVLSPVGSRRNNRSAFREPRRNAHERMLLFWRDAIVAAGNAHVFRKDTLVTGWKPLVCHSRLVGPYATS